MVATKERSWPQGEELRRVMEAQGRHHSWLAKKVGVWRETVSRWMSGTLEPQERHKRAIEDALGLPCDYFKPAKESQP